MSRQPAPGAGAAVRSPSGVAACAPSPSSAPSPSLTPQRYRALRARYNALLVTLYERTSLTLREIASLAGRTDRAVQMLVRALGCRPRNARSCRPGTDVGVRREGPRPPPLNAPATRRVVAAFAGVARELTASTEARAASEAQRATARAARRTVRTQSRVIAGAARSLRHVAAAIEDTAAMEDALAGVPMREAKHSRARKPAKAPQPRSRVDVWRAQQRVQRQQEARMQKAHIQAAQAASGAYAAPAAAPPLKPDAARRSDGMAERAPGRMGAEPGRPPRVRRLW